MASENQTDGENEGRSEAEDVHRGDPASTRHRWRLTEFPEGSAGFEVIVVAVNLVGDLLSRARFRLRDRRGRRAREAETKAG